MQRVCVAVLSNPVARAIAKYNELAKGVSTVELTTVEVAMLISTIVETAKDFPDDSIIRDALSDLYNNRAIAVLPDSSHHAVAKKLVTKTFFKKLQSNAAKAIFFSSPDCSQ